MPLRAANTRGASNRLERLLMTNSTLSIPQTQISFGTKSHVDTGALLNRDGWMCVYCGRWLTLDDMTVDHVLPTLRGGPDALDNCVLSCLGCNAKKGDFDAVEFRHWLAVRRYAFVIAPNELITYEPVELVIGKGRKQTSTVIALPALWSGDDMLHEEHVAEWESCGAINVMMTRQHERLDVMFLHGVLYDYYAMKQQIEKVCT